MLRYDTMSTSFRFLYSSLFFYFLSARFFVRLFVCFIINIFLYVSISFGLSFGQLPRFHGQFVLVYIYIRLRKSLYIIDIAVFLPRHRTSCLFILRRRDIVACKGNRKNSSFLSGPTTSDPQLIIICFDCRLRVISVDL